MWPDDDAEEKAFAGVAPKDFFKKGGRDKLIHSPYGIMPASGEVESLCRPHVHPQRYMRGTEVQYRGKKHIDPHYMNISDDAKREAGRCGKKHCLDVSKTNGKAVSEILSSFKQKNTAVESTCRLHNNNTSTSAQLARARLLKLSRDPRYREAANEILQKVPDSSIVQKEEQLSRRIASVEYAKESAMRCAQLQKEQKALDLGAPSETIKTNVPFALDVSTPRPDTAKLPRSSYYHNAESTSAVVDAAPRPRTVAREKKTPDNVLLSQNDYPDPPAVGVRVCARVAPRPNPSMMCTTKTFDEEIMRHARARCHQRVDTKMPDFIFGQPPPPRAPHMTLRSTTEQRWKAEDELVAQRRTGKAMTHQSYKPTSLW